MKDLALHILDIVQNSVSAGAKLVEISIEDDSLTGKYSLIIKDDGRGMDDATLKKVTDPYFTSRTTRKVGLGIPLLKMNAERTGGSFSIESQPGAGTTISASFNSKHIDILPEGDIAGTITLLASSNPEMEFIYNHKTSKGEYCFSTVEIKEVLGEVPISNPGVYSFLKEMIEENLKEIKSRQTDI